MTQKDREMLVRIDERVGQMHLTLYGNGNPEKGMSRRFDHVEANQEKCIQDRERKRLDLRWFAIFILAVFEIYVTFIK